MGEWGQVPAVCDFKRLSQVNAVTGYAAYTKGNYADLIAPAPFDIKNFWIACVEDDRATRQVADIAVGASGSEKIFLSDYSITHLNSYGMTRHRLLPMHFQVKAGERVSARSADNTNNSEYNYQVSSFVARQSTFLPDATNIEGYSFGVDGSSYQTSIDPGGTVSTYGSYYQLIASTPWDAKGLFLVTGINNAAPSSAWWYFDVAVGAEGSEVNIFTGAFNLINATDPGLKFLPYIPIPIKAGTRISARALCSINDAADRLFCLAGTLIR